MMTLLKVNIVNSTDAWYMRHTFHEIPIQIYGLAIFENVQKKA